MSKHRIGIAIWAVSLLSIFWITSTQAQTEGGGWSDPIRLSSEAGKASDGYMAADQYGFVHTFWTETLFEDQRILLKYDRFDGGTWTQPNDIYLTNNGIENISPFVDQYGILHIAWAEGLYNPSAYYTYAPANNAQSAKNWAQPIQIDVPAGFLQLQVDSKGVIHILYIRRTEDPGVYYIRSEDQGTTWSEPVWLDPDILPNHIPDSLNFELDETGGLHAVWYYGALDQTSRPDWVRYAHSLDGGNSWSAPIILDQVDELSHHFLTSAGPVMIIQGQTVHVIWAAGELPYRYHRFSTDAGRTWSAPKHIFGELHGQAGDDLAVDGAGRVHFFGQIRYPIGIYHAYWDHNRWTRPSMIYLIAQEGQVIDDRIHAHSTRPIVRAGNQLILTFGDGPADPNRRLFAMYRTLDDISSLELVPTSVPTATPLPEPTPTPGQPTPMPTLTAIPPVFDRAAEPVGDIPKPDLVIWVVLVPNLLLFAGFITIQFLNKLKR